MNTFYWLLKREYWEHRGQVLRTPLITGAIFVLVNIMGIIAAEVTGHRNGFNFGIFNNVPDISTINPEVLHKFGLALDAATYVIVALIVSVTAVVMFFYCLGALYDDRKDRSILLWKSLPISDRDTVLSKLVTAVVIAPVIAAVTGIIVAWVVTFLFAITGKFHGINGFALMWQGHPLRIGADILLSLPVYVLWALPTAGWLLLCSAWAKGKPFRWAILLPIGAAVMLSWLSLIGLADGVAEWFWQHVVVRILLGLLPGGWLPESFHATVVNGHVHVHNPDEVMAFFGLGQTYHALAMPNIWIGAVAGALMIAGAIWLRRWRDDS